MYFSGQGMPDVCLNVTSGPLIRQRSGLGLQDGQFLPAKGCLLLSPANLWNKDIERYAHFIQTCLFIEYAMYSIIIMNLS